MKPRPADLPALARRLRALTRARDVTFLVNDDVALAARVDADGAHIGQDDMPLAEARRILGPHRILGASAGCVQEVRNVLDGHNSGLVDYIGVGPVWETGSKPDAGAAIGTQGLREVVEEVAGRVKTVAIGGVKQGRLAMCRSAGVDGVAVVAAVMHSQRPAHVARQLREEWLRACQQGS